MAKIFISYRRTDIAEQAGRIFDRLVMAFSKANVFKDVDSVPAGADFRQVLDVAVRKSDVVVLIIGPMWLIGADEKGRRRLDDPDDFVRLELEYSLEEDKRIIPVLVRGGVMPHPSELPESIRSVSYRHAVTVRPDPDFHRDMDRVIYAIKARDYHEYRIDEKPRKSVSRWLLAVSGVVGLLMTLALSSKFFGFRKARDPRGGSRAERRDPRQIASTGVE